jgi:hypothetical protein
VEYVRTIEPAHLEPPLDDLGELADDQQHTTYGQLVPTV